MWSTSAAGRGRPAGVEEREYESLAREAFDRVIDMFDDVDPDDVDVEQAGDVITLTCASGKRVVMNTQRPARQIWLAGDERAWHFSFDPDRAGWFDDKRPDEELLTTIRGLMRTLAQVEIGDC